MSREIIRRRFPTYEFVLPTSAPFAAASAEVAARVTPRFRFVDTHVVASAGGANVYVTVHGQTFWRWLHVLLVAVAAVGMALSYAWGEVLVGTVIAGILLALSVAYMVTEAREVADVLATVLPE